MMKQLVRRIWIPAFIAILTFSSNLSAAAADDYSKKSVTQLIDDLTQIDSPAPGIDSGAVSLGFLADEASISFAMGVLGVPPPKIPPQMRELVVRGPLALPELIKHLDDRRPTKLEVGNKPGDPATRQVGVDYFWWTVFSEEYDPRSRRPSDEKPKTLEEQMANHFQGRYTVKVADVCYVLIGQIVNRGLLSVRYQASAGLMVNSPIEVPALAEKVRNDWGKVGAEELRASLLSDLRETSGSETSYTQRFNNSALQRIRLYFPDTYNALEGDDLKKKEQFEKDEAKRESARQK